MLQMFFLLNWMKEGYVNIRIRVKCLLFDLGMLLGQATLAPEFCLILSNLSQKTNSRTEQKPISIK